MISQRWAEQGAPLQQKSRHLSRHTFHRDRRAVARSHLAAIVVPAAASPKRASQQRLTCRFNTKQSGYHYPMAISIAIIYKHEALRGRLRCCAPDRPSSATLRAKTSVPASAPTSTACGAVRYRPNGLQALPLARDDDKESVQRHRRSAGEDGITASFTPIVYLKAWRGAVIFACWRAKGMQAASGQSPSPASMSSGRRLRREGATVPSAIAQTATDANHAPCRARSAYRVRPRQKYWRHGSTHRRCLKW